MEKVRIGVVGCGAIAQVHHMPSLSALADYYEVPIVCDISAKTAKYVAERYHVPRYVTDYRQILAADVDAVLLCQSDPKTEAAVATFEAGKHLFIEKPMCFSLEEAEAIVAAQKRSGKVGQVGYMKVYDPAYEYAKQEVEQMDNIRFVQVNHLHPDNALHVDQFHITRFDDYPPGAAEELEAARTAARREAIGEAPPHVELAFHILAGSLIHDLYGLREMLGVPSEVLSTEIWQEGRAVTTVFAYPNGSRAVVSWVDLSNLWDFKETLEIYGDDKRVIVSYPTGFARGILSAVTVQGIDERGTTYRQEPAIDWETAFMRELRHFHQCLVEGIPTRTSVESAVADIALIIDIIKRYNP